MNNDKDFVLQTMKDTGKARAQDLQEKSPDMTGTELYAEDTVIPDFQAAKAKANMLTRQAGFVCKSPAGRVVKLLQPYDSSIYTAEPEELPAQWGFVWSDDPYKAKDFVALSTSPYMTGNCAAEGGYVYRSNIDNNVWAPSGYSQGWTLLGPVGGPFEEA